MATDLGRVKSPATNKYDSVVASHLEEAEKRIRLLDLSAGLLGFTSLSLAYIVLMVVCDANWMLAARTRQLSLVLFCIGGGAYLVWAVLRPLRLRVNPYYAARRVEQLLPNAKNSIVNWVDLHAQPLPPAIRGALGQRAAKDVVQVDLERAIGGRRAGWMGGLAAAFAVAFVISFLLLGPAPFFSLLKRTFNPFSSATGISTRTQLDILKPVGGDAVVTVGQSIPFVVEVGGRVPDPKAADAVRLLYRHEDGDPWLERPLLQEPSREWTTSLSAAEVKNGFWYRVAGGDATTPEYRVSVRAAPAITDFLATYHFRPYVVRADELRRERDLKELRGTEVLLRVRTNRTLSKGWLEFEGKNGKSVVLGTLDPTEPRCFLVRQVLNEDGKYRLFFLSTEDESYADADASPVTAIPDAPPVVELTEPGKDIRLPADGLLSVGGKAGDDIGVKSVRLRMRVIGGDKLQDKPYRSDEQMRLADGGYPREVEYKDFVELSGVRGEDGRAVALRAGMELEYWLEASDACDYPQAGVTESKHFRVLLTEPEKNQDKQKRDKQQAEIEKKKHEQQQDQQRQKEEAQRQQQKREQQARNQEEENKSKENEKGTGEPGQAKDGERKNDSENKNDNGGQGEKNEGANKNDNGGQADNKNDQGEKNDLPNEDQKTEEQIKNALEKKEEKQGEGKPETCEQGEGKGDRNQPDGGEASGAKPQSENKGAEGQESKTSSENKEKGQSQAGNDASKGDGKGENASTPPDGDKGEGKQGGDPKNQSGEGKSGEPKGQPEAAPSSGENKPSGNPDTKKEGGEGKPQPQGQGKESSDNKPVGEKGEQTQQQTGEAKDNNNPSRGEAKTEGESKSGANAERKPDPSSPREDSSAKGDAKPSAGEGEKDQSAQAQSKPDGGAQARNASAKDVRDLQRELENKNDAAREEAERQLERIEKEAFDPDAREKAGEALDKKQRSSGSSDKNEANQGDESSGTKNGEKKGQSGSKKGDKRNGQNTQGSGSANGGGGDRNSGKADEGGRGGASTPSKPEKPGSHRAAQMQLEDFAKRVDKDILKEAGVSEEAWKKYLESKRKQVVPRATSRPEAPVDPQQAKPLPSMGGRTIEPSGSGPGDAHGPDRGQPPPGYRDAFREFTRQMSKGK